MPSRNRWGPPYDAARDLPALRLAVADYRARDRHKDQVLYDLCAAHPGQDDRLALYLKCIFVCRVYGIHIERLLAGPALRSGLPALIDAIHANRALFAREVGAVQRLGDRLTLHAANRIMAAHGRLTAALVRGRKHMATAPAVFVSKYLHCHAPIVPLYDRWAADPLAAMLPKMRRMPGLTAAEVAFTPFVTVMTRTLFLLDDVNLRLPKLRMNVKELDYYLVNRPTYLARVQRR